MRIAITQKKRSWSGQSVHVWELARGLLQKDHDVWVVSPPGSEFTKRAQAAGLPVRPMEMNGTRQFSAFWRLGHFLRCNRIEVLHCHDSRDHQIGCFAARLAGTPAIVRTKHNALPLRNFGSRLIYGRLTSRVISVSNAVKDALIRSGIARDQITTIYNFVDTEEFKPQKPSVHLSRSLGIPDGAPVVGTVGRLHRSKGIEDLIRAVPLVAAREPEVIFLFLGSRAEQWQSLVHKLSVQKHCLFPGRVSNVAHYLNLMDVAVFPTLRDAFSLSILEAMAAARPVVATAVEGVVELIEHEHDGLLVEPHHPDQLADAVLGLLRHADLADRMGAMARRTASRKFTREKAITKTEEVYRMALAG